MNNLRSVEQSFIDSFKDTDLYKWIIDRPEEFMVCIRDNAIGIYYNCDRVALVEMDGNGRIVCKTNSYYVSDYYLQQGRRAPGVEGTYSQDFILEKLKKNVIQHNSELRSTPEKKLQHRLVFENNSNPDSEWFCFDIEYRQSEKVQAEVEKFSGRFDILAISKHSPHQIAVIEVKYNTDSFKGSSGIVAHLKDFLTFNKSSSCKKNLQKEIPMILQNLASLNVSVPQELQREPMDIKTDNIRFDFICLYSNKPTKGSAGGYLFNERRPRWDTVRISSKNAMDDPEFGLDIESEDCPVNVTFFFKKVDNLSKAGVSDILSKKEYDEVI